MQYKYSLYEVAARKLRMNHNLILFFSTEKKPTMTTYEILGLVWFILSLLIIIILIIIVVMQYRKNRTESCENRTESWGKSEK